MQSNYLLPGNPAADALTERNENFSNIYAPAVVLSHQCVGSFSRISLGRSTSSSSSRLVAVPATSSLWRGTDAMWDLFPLLRRTWSSQLCGTCDLALSYVGSLLAQLVAFAIWDLCLSLSSPLGVTFAASVGCPQLHGALIAYAMWGS